MKANELMIGDWVSYKGNPTKIRTIEICNVDVGPLQVTITYGDRICGLTVIDVSMLKPIPLTPEILEKNFQEFLPGINLMYQLNGPYCAMNEDGQWVFGLVKVDGENSARYPLVKISFVHQLQNALRLCGIEKEIIV